MIAKLSGTIDSMGADWAVVDVGGVGYLVQCPALTLGRLSVGIAASLHVETVVRDDAILLFGFLEASERDWFRLLTTVQGVGAKAALAILSVLPPDGLVAAIASGDKAAVSRAAGVGAKLAARVISELKDKVGVIALGPGMPAGNGVAVPATSRATADAVSGLVNLGYSPSDALRAVTQAAGRLGEDAGVEALIRAGLSEVSGREAPR